MIYPLAALRALSLHTQGLATPNQAPVTRDLIYATIQKIVCLQLDAIQQVQRSQYIVLWSRLGQYDPADLDRLFSDEDRRLYEYWLHAACLLPLETYRYLLPKMDYFREAHRLRTARFLQEEGSAEVVDKVLEVIRAEGAKRASDFEDKRREAGWWNWKPSKRALEHLHDQGYLMTRERRKFQRVYDLPERVLPDWVDTTPTTPDEAHWYWIEEAARALGVNVANSMADYILMTRGLAKPYVGDMLKSGVLLEIQGETLSGQTQTFLIHRDNLPALEQASAGAIKAEHTTFLSPFDPLFYSKERTEALWGFTQRLEAYTPAPKRIWGYFSLPILHEGRLIGRFDPNLDRKAKLLRLKALHLEPNVNLDENLIAKVAGALREFMAFHDAEDVAIEVSKPPEFGEKLLAAL